MLYLIYREDTNGVRYYICGDLLKIDAEAMLRRFTSGRPHKQDYEILAYNEHEKQKLMRDQRIHY